MDTKEQLTGHLEAIQVWENDQKGLWFWEKLGRLPFKILDKMTPAFIQEKIGVLVSELGSYIQTGGRYLISEEGMLKKIRVATYHPVQTIEEVGQIPLNNMITLSEELQKSRVKFATVQGASTGFGGLFTLAIDIPVVLGTALKRERSDFK